MRTTCCREEMSENQERHLRGNWLQYWEHEVGLMDQQDTINFKQIKLMTCSGPGTYRQPPTLYCQLAAHVELLE